MTLIGNLKNLESWFFSHARILPWRENPAVYRVWVSEIMLQQTQVATVIPYFEKFMARFPGLEDLARAEESEVLLYWAGLGYYSRAKNLHKAAQMIQKAGRFPESRKDWLAVPGVGNYTAGAVLSIAQNQPEAILDGNVERVLSRIRLSSGKQRLWKVSEILVKLAAEQEIQPGIFNQALMELGALICSPRKPDCGVCPLSRMCKAKKYSRQEEFPEKRKRPEWKKIEEGVFVLVFENRIYLEQRKDGQWRAGLWDFPSALPETVSSGTWKKGKTFETRYVVTHHRVTRIHQVFSVSEQDFKVLSVLGQWLNLTPAKKELPLGSAVAKVLKKLVHEDLFS